MNDLFRPYLRTFILVFFDDILVYSKTFEDHLTHLQVVFTILAANNLCVKESKCRFSVSQVDYLGHIISEKGVAVDPTKIQVVLNWLTPTNQKGFIIECDASGIGIRAVLSLNKQLVAYFSEALKGSALQLSTYEKEMLAMIEYKKGSENQAADSLSRMAEFQFLAISMPHAQWWPTLQEEVKHDTFYENLSQSSAYLLQRDGVWFKNDKVYLSPASSLIHQVTEDCHSSPTGGHFGFHKTLSRIKASFPAGLLQPLPIPAKMWTDVSMDFIEGLPLSNGYSVIMVIVDRLTKYAHFMALKHPFTAMIVAKSFIANVVRLHGVPTFIVSDRDKVFISSFWQALFKLHGTKLCMSSSYHPQTNFDSVHQNLCFSGIRARLESNNTPIHVTIITQEKPAMDEKRQRTQEKKEEQR
ncbi:transposon ty3-G gag-pol polyprotein [Tanacetum coccineum]